MHHDDALAQIDDLIGNGRFKEAQNVAHSKRLELQRTGGPRHASAAIELSFYLGDFGAAARASERLLKDTDSSPARATAHRVLGEILANQLDFETSLGHFSLARSCVDRDVAPVVRASVELSYWAWFSGIVQLQSAESEFAVIRRTVLASGLPSQVAELRLCTARVEARKGNLLEASRHWGVASRLLSDSVNSKLQSQLWLDGCMISLLRGDLRAALEGVERAALHAEQSGYFRTAIGSQIARSQVLHAIGDLRQAREVAKASVELSRPYRQLLVSALDCLANILVAENDIAAAEAVFEEIEDTRPHNGAKLLQHWDVLSD